MNGAETVRQSDADHILAAPSSPVPAPFTGTVESARSNTGTRSSKICAPRQHRDAGTSIYRVVGSKPPGIGARPTPRDTGLLTYDTQAHALRREPHGDLVRQAYLLTGDPARAHELADRAARIVEARAHRLGPAEALERAKEELVRSYVADPGRPPPVAAGGPTPHPDVAMWRAVCRLAPRRRAAIVLRYDEGLSEEHAAARMDTTPRLLRADVDAAMLTLRTAVPGVADPWTRVADALAAAGRGWSDYTRPAAARVAEVISAPAPTPAPRPAPRPAHGATRAARPRSARLTALAAGAVAALAAGRGGGRAAAGRGRSRAGRARTSGRGAGRRGNGARRSHDPWCPPSTSPTA